MKKVLIIGPEYFSINESIANAFSEFGFKTKIFNFSESYPVNYKTKITHGFLSKLGLNYFINKYNDKINKEILEIYKIYNPDIVLIVKGHKIYKDTLMEMQNANLVLWMMDSVKRVNSIMSTIKLYDFVFVFEEEDVVFLKQKNIKALHLPLALDQNLYWPNNNDKVIDIIFIGSLYPERIKLLKQIIKEFPEKKIVVYGFFPSWFINLKNFNLRIGGNRDIFNLKPVNPKDVNLLYSKAHVILNLHLNYSLSGCNLRFFEIAGTKSIQIVNRKTIIDKEFNMESLVFDEDQQLIKIINDIFKGNIDTDKIVEGVYQDVIKNHTYKNRIETILKYLS